MGTFQKNTQPRLPGHRPLFRSRYAVGGDGTRKEVNGEARSRVSLSDFLDKKLHKKSDNVPPKTVRGKLTPFSSPLGARGDTTSTGHRTTESNQIVFEQFKHSGILEESVSDSPGSGKTAAFTSSVELSPRCGSSSSTDERTMTWRNPFEGSTTVSKDMSTLPSEETRHRNKGRASHKPLIVFGDNPAPKQKEGEENFASWNRKRKRFYNHYGNGGGWWDSDREGVDAEEVGFGEIWEGVGSTTFGGIDWH